MIQISGFPNMQGYQTQQADQTAKIRFENALAAARTASDKATPADVDQVDFASALPNAQVTRAIPVNKVIQSLSKLVQNNPHNTYGNNMDEPFLLATIYF